MLSIFHSNVYQNSKNIVGGRPPAFQNGWGLWAYDYNHILTNVMIIYSLMLWAYDYDHMTTML